MVTLVFMCRCTLESSNSVVVSNSHACCQLGSNVAHHITHTVAIEEVSERQYDFANIKLNKRIGLSPSTRATPLQSTPNLSPYQQSISRNPLSNLGGEVPVAGPSRLTEALEKFSEHEVERLSAVRMGFGISRYDADELFEECDHCRMVFMRSALRVHIKRCADDDK